MEHVVVSQHFSTSGGKVCGSPGAATSTPALKSWGTKNVSTDFVRNWIPAVRNTRLARSTDRSTCSRVWLCVGGLFKDRLMKRSGTTRSVPAELNAAERSARRGWPGGASSGRSDAQPAAAAAATRTATPAPRRPQAASTRGPTSRVTSPPDGSTPRSVRLGGDGASVVRFITS